MFPTSHTWGSALRLSHKKNQSGVSEEAMHSVTVDPNHHMGLTHGEVILEPMNQLHEQAWGKPVEELLSECTRNVRNH